ncbi:ABC transporter permease [Chitinophaga sp. Hz27]|uniref:ABC transporter permease n=1 Tax=Chitinophaga sp. Hz27 TaxID=3347169 RepID=UPI0035DAB303
MFKNYYRLAWRNLQRSKGFAIINILGLAIGMAIVILIGLWVEDELSYDKSIPGYNRNVQLMHHWNDEVNKKIATVPYLPIPAATELKTKYSAYFKYVALARPTTGRIFGDGEKKMSRSGLYAEQDLASILSLQILSGGIAGMNDPNSVFISASTAAAFFGKDNAVNKTLKFDNKTLITVAGVYADFPRNSSFYGTDFILPWAHLVAEKSWVKNAYDQWNNNSFQLYAQLAPNANQEKAANAIKLMLQHRSGRNDGAVLFMHPMSKWHLYEEFTNGVNTGGSIRYVVIFGIVGLFVLILACINFMNLNTARSQKRAKEVGVRKAIGSERKQLIFQFLIEAILVAGLALVISLLMVILSLPWFNSVADKQIHFPYTSPLFWGIAVSMVLITGLLAGSYPAFYLSSFNALKVLKGTFKVNPVAALPRKVLVVVQFSVSVALIIGTFIILQQIKYAKERPLGYDQNGLINISMSTPDLYGKYDLLRTELMSSGAAINMAEASNSASVINAHLGGFDWTGKNPEISHVFGVSWVSHDFGNTVGWQFVAGRDFSRNFSTDSNGIILNESAIALMGITSPIGATIRFDDHPFHILGIIKNVVMESPFDKAAPAAFMMDYDNVSDITIRLNPAMSTHQAIGEIEKVMKKYNPAAPFEYRFINDEFNNKFKTEERVGKLTSSFAILAIFISCLGIFGLATFTAEQRTKEIGIRKVLGASVVQLWTNLSREFLILVFIAFAVAMPLAWTFMSHWLNAYEYRVNITIWTFIFTAVLTLMITLSTVSYQALKAALANPVDSLKAE